MIHFVGAGPGASDLITVRGARFLSEADVIVHAGSLVNPTLLERAKPGATVLDSAGMTLEQVLSVMKEAETAAKATVRLHTGDPSLYGAIREQMDALSAAGIPFDVTPGVSSLFGAAAALKAEYTLPGVSQSVIVTRVDGRTPVPAGERLRDMAAHGCTIALFLSTGLLDRVERELAAGGFAPDAPAAIVYKATWPDERVLRCTVSTLARTAGEAGIANTALVLVGGFLAGPYDRSKLYDPAFSHGFRAASAREHAGRIPCSIARKGAERIPSSIALIAFTEQGCRLAARLAEGLAREGARTSVVGPARFAEACGIEAYGSVASWVDRHFPLEGALVFVSAAGIAVRCIAPHVRDKFSDPAVVSVDEAGMVAVPLLSGHVGAANDVARAVARLTGGQAAVSTATDINGLFAVDEWARDQDLALVEREVAKEVSAALLEGRQVGFASEFAVEGPLPAGFGEAAGQMLGVYVGFDTACAPFARTLHLVPRTAALGLGARRGVSEQALEGVAACALAAAGVPEQAVAAVASIDLKRDEAGLARFAEAHGWPLRFFSAEELQRVGGSFSESEFVRAVTGTDNVCERAAVACGGELRVRKVAGDGATAALALARPCVGFPSGGEAKGRA